MYVIWHLLGSDLLLYFSRGLPLDLISIWLRTSRCGEWGASWLWISPPPLGPWCSSPTFHKAYKTKENHTQPTPSAWREDRRQILKGSPLSPAAASPWVWGIWKGCLRSTDQCTQTRGVSAVNAQILTRSKDLIGHHVCCGEDDFPETKEDLSVCTLKESAGYLGKLTRTTVS